jgi:hypothetical protein
MADKEFFGVDVKGNELRERMTETRNVYKDALDEYAKLEGDTSDGAAKARELLLKEMDAAEEACDAAREQWEKHVTGDRRANGVPGGAKSLGKRLLRSDVDLGRKDLAPAGTIVADELLDTIVGLDQRVPSLLDLVTSRPTTADQVS